MMSTGPMWTPILKTALIGTDRQSPVLPQPQTPFHPQMARLLQTIDWSDAERALLSAAGAIALYQQAGQCPPTIPLPQPCNELESSRSLCSSKTVEHLRQVLNRDADLCAELLEGVARCQQQLPAECLPALLDAGVRHPELQPYIIDVLGSRGRWLAAQNPEWEYAQWDWDALMARPSDDSDPSPSSDPLPLPEAGLTLWQTGQAQQRLTALQHWRMIAPDMARQLIETTWSQESAKDRAAFLSALSIGLSGADESFLEAALSDRSPSVRITAVHLLASLVTSRWCQQMTAWGRSLITFTPTSDQASTPADSIRSPLGTRLERKVKWTVHVTLPTDEDKACAQEAVPLLSQSVSKRRQGQQTDWLIEIIGSMALSSWAEDGEPTDLIQAMMDHKYGPIFLKGWAMATIRQQHPQWAEALLTQHYLVPLSMRSVMMESDRGDIEWVTQLLQVLPQDRCEALLMAASPSATQQQISLLSGTHDELDSLDRGTADGAVMALWFHWVVHASRGWSVSFSEVILIQLQREISHNLQSYVQQLQSLARPLALCLHPSLSDSTLLIALAERRIPGPVYLKKGWDRAIASIRSLLSQRQTICGEFTDHVGSVED